MNPCIIEFGLLRVGNFYSLLASKFFFLRLLDRFDKGGRSTKRVLIPENAFSRSLSVLGPNRRRILLEIQCSFLRKSV